MAEVTGLTAEAMERIANETITGARIEASNLILSTHEGTDLNVGKVMFTDSDLASLITAGTTLTAMAMAAKIVAEAGPAGTAAANAYLAQNPNVAAAAAALAQSDAGLLRSTDVRLPQNILDTRYVRAWVDSTLRTALGIREDGSVHVPGLLETQELKALIVNGSEFISTSPNISGVVAGFVDSERRQSELVIGPDGRVPSWVISAWASRLASLIPAPTPTGFKSSYSDSVIKAVSGPDMIAWGDSMTGASIYHARVAQVTGKTVRMGGVGGEGRLTIFARQGSDPMLIAAGAVLPASSTEEVAVTLKYSNGSTARPLLQGNGGAGYPGGDWRTMEVDLIRNDTPGGEKIRGRLRLQKEAGKENSYIVDPGDVYYFRRDVAGTSFTLSRDSAIVTPFSEARRGDIALFWVGRNGVNDFDGNVYGMEAAIRHMQAAEKRFIVISVCNGEGEGTGTANHTAIKAMNDRWRMLYGRRFVDIRRYLIDKGLAEAGITPTAQDTADVTADIIPDSLRADTVHFETVAYNILGNLVGWRLKELGWV